jgi:hypothetical protein
VKITFEASEIFPPISRAFSFLTNGAKICVNDIQYDGLNGIVRIPMKRPEWTEQDRKGCLFGWLRQPHFTVQNWIESVLIIRQVIKMKMDVDNLLVTECGSCFTVMMGMKIEKDEVYLGSLEEASGKTLCNIYISVKAIDLEFLDLV